MKRSRPREIASDGRIRVWDAAVRLLHWLLAGLVLFDYFVEDDGGWGHRTVGYIAVGVVCSRLLWSGLGEGANSFAALRRRFARPSSTAEKAPPRTMAHDPFGLWMVWHVLPPSCSGAGVRRAGARVPGARRMVLLAPRRHVLPNRFDATTGRLDRDAHGQPELNNGHAIEPSVSKSVFDHLSERGVSWRYYEHGYGFARLFDRWRLDDTNLVGIDDPERGFFAAARDGTLPSVSYIDPDFIEVPPGNDDHAPSDLAAGQHLIGRIVNALVDGPAWPKTLLLVTYDEHGGFYDHVRPLQAVPVSGIDRYGVRVPALVVSPWVDRGAASHVVFDHTSILQTICRRFMGQGTPDLGDRVADAKDLSAVLRSSARPERPTIPLPPPPAANGRIRLDAVDQRVAGKHAGGLAGHGNHDARGGLAVPGRSRGRRLRRRHAAPIVVAGAAGAKCPKGAPRRVGTSTA